VSRDFLTLFGFAAALAGVLERDLAVACAMRHNYGTRKANDLKSRHSKAFNASITFAAGARPARRSARGLAPATRTVKHA
jgi:hypothetical protein